MAVFHLFADIMYMADVFLFADVMHVIVQNLDVLLRTKLSLGQHSSCARVGMCWEDGGRHQRSKNPFEPDALLCFLSEAAGLPAAAVALDGDPGPQRRDGDNAASGGVAAAGEGDAQQRQWQTAGEVRAACHLRGCNAVIHSQL